MNSATRLLIRRSAVLAGLALAWACSDDSSTAPAIYAPVAVLVSPEEVRLDAPGSTSQLTAHVLDGNGQLMTEVAVTWSSSSAGVAAVNSTGLVTAAANGQATITATAGGAAGTMAVTVARQTAGNVATDRAALVALYQATDGPNWVNSENWLTDSPLGEWFGVSTNHEGRVVALEMAYYDWDADQWISNNVSGPIPPELGSLTRLEHLQFFDNKLTGAIPPELGNLANLTTLDFASNDVSGSIPPEIASLAKLTSLNLGGNSLSGSIPPELGGLANLTLLWLWSNNLTGPIPAELGGLVNLTLLWLWSNNLTGPIPAELGGLVNLTSLSLWENELTGPIPVELGSLVNLTDLNLSGNALNGPIPVQLGKLASLTDLILHGNDLSGPIPPALGHLANLATLDFASNDVSGSIPPEIASLAKLTSLSLGGNSLSGSIPPELGGLANLEWLSLGWNKLEGPIPQSFLQLDRLQAFYIGGNEGLCAPGTSAFVAWLEGIEDQDESGALCNESDWKLLESLFERAAGSGWTNADGWVSGPALDEWHGVRADSLGRVVVLDLEGNGLSGRLLSTMGELARLAELRIADNPDLSGRLPLSLADLSLRVLHYDGTGLCVDDGASFQQWLSAVTSHEGTEAECPPLSDREALEALWEGTGGADWVQSENWLTDAPLGDWHGVEVDDSGRVVALALSLNNVRGRIPREIGGLANLEWLDLYRNGLTGPIPVELGDLSDLWGLYLGENGLTGTIPPELGKLANLGRLILNENDLTGPIPAELGELSNLVWVNLNYNRLTGPIPPTLGGLANIVELALGGNELTGPIPPELGDLVYLRKLNLSANRLTGAVPLELGSLADLEVLYLGENALTGPVPPEFGGLVSLRHLALQTNAEMSGALPDSLTNLPALETLQAGGTGLCSPSGSGFQEWLAGVPNRRVAPCEGEPALAYLVQSVQSRRFPVPLVAGEEALLRVFVTAGRDNAERLPPVRASFTLNGTLAHVANIPGKPGPIPTEVEEGSLAASANAVIPAEVVQPGLEMVVEIDPDETLDPALGVARRIQAAVEVRAMPDLDLTLVPFLWTEDPDSAIVEAVGGMAADPDGHELLGPTRMLLPVGGLDVTAHEAVLSSSNNAYHLLNQTEAIRVMEGGSGYFMGMMSGEVTGAGGLGGGVVSFSIDNAFVIGHEFGHNFSLPHAPCGGAGNPDGPRVSERGWLHRSVGLRCATWPAGPANRGRSDDLLRSRLGERLLFHQGAPFPARRR